MTVPTTILVVDDDPEVRSILHRCFELDGYHVIEAMNGEQMRVRLAENAVSLITLDLKMPGEDGLTLAREIRAQKNVPIIMVTGRDDPIDRVVGL
ncbi:MAG: response regulator, partial [Hyphomicrobiaceae bacterium]